MNNSSTSSSCRVDSRSRPRSVKAWKAEYESCSGSIPFDTMTAPFGICRSGWNRAPFVPWMQCARFHPDLQMPKGAVIVSKGMDPEQDSYSAFQAFTDRGRDLESTLHELDVDELFICGLATDYCVRATTLDGLRRGLDVRVLRDAIRGVDLKPGDSEMAMKEMRLKGVRFSDSRGLARLLPKD